jgi:tetratricopeptide (TPR) repeat protein
VSIYRRIDTEKLFYLVVFFLFFIYVSDIYAAIKIDDDSKVNRYIVIHKFNMEGGSGSLSTLESLLPEVLKAYFLGHGWHATIISELGAGEVGEFLPKGKERVPLRNTQRAPETQVAGPDFSIRGSFYESKGIVIIETYIEHTKSGEKIPVDMKFDKRDLLQGIESLGKKLEKKMGDFILKPAEGKKLILAVPCFDSLNVRSADQSDADVAYAWMRQQFAKDLSLACQEIEMVQVARWTETKSLCDETLDELLENLNADLIVTGEYKVVNDETLNVRADLLDSSSQDKLGPIDMTGSLDDFFGLEKDFSELVKEIVVLFLNPTETLQARNLFAQDLDANALLRAGEESSKQGRRAIALWLYDKALKKNRNLPYAHFQIGVIHEEKENYDKAIDEFKKAVELKPDCSEAFVHLGNIAIKRGESEKAIENYGRAIDIGDDLEAEARLKLGDVYFLRGGFDDALSEYEAARERNPHSADTYYALGLVFMAKRNYYEAIPNLEKALTLNPHHSEALSNLARAYYQYGEELLRKSGNEPIKKEELEHAVSLLKRSIELQKSAEAYGRLAWAYSSLKKYQEAELAAQKAVELDPDYAWYHAGLGRILLEQSKREEAVKELLRATNLDPEHVFAHLYLGVAYKELGNKKLAKDSFERAWDLGFDKGDYISASLAMDYASEMAPGNSLYFARSGEAYRMLKQYDKALVALKKAVSMEKQSPWVYGSLGDVYRLQGDYDQAEAQLKEAIKLDSEDSWAYAHLGETYRQKGDYDKAEAQLERAIQLNPEYAWAYASLGETYRQKGDYDKAEAQLERAIELNPEYAWAYASLGETYRQKGDYDKAEAQLKRAIELNPEDDWAFAGLGRVYIDKGDQDKAVANFKKALELNPAFAWAYNELAAIIHDNMFDYDEAFRYARKAVEVESKAPKQKNLLVYDSTLAESLVTVGHFDEAFRKAEGIISNTDDQTIGLNMRLIQIVSLLLQEKEAEARSKVDEFIEFYEELPKDFENTWSYSGMLHFLETQNEISKEKKEMIISLIQCLRKEIEVSQLEVAVKKYFDKENISKVYFLTDHSIALTFRQVESRDEVALSAFKNRGRC